MNILLVIASIALANCSPTDTGIPLCYTDVSQDVVYAFDASTCEGLIVEHSSDNSYTTNTSYRYSPAGHDFLLQETWTVDEEGIRDFGTRLLQPGYFVDIPRIS